LLFTQRQAELWVFGINLFVLGSEDNHDTVLQEIVELDRVRVQALTFKVVDSEQVISEI
jgi:hypothetical protein